MNKIELYTQPLALYTRTSLEPHGQISAKIASNIRCCWVSLSRSFPGILVKQSSVHMFHGALVRDFCSAKPISYLFTVHPQCRLQYGVQ